MGIYYVASGKQLGIIVALKIVDKPFFVYFTECSIKMKGVKAI
jgi:predicted acetyltransferase